MTISDLVDREGLSELIFKLRSQCQKGTGHTQFRGRAFQAKERPYLEKEHSLWKE